jgi:hypothetical protein
VASLPLPTNILELGNLSTNQVACLGGIDLMRQEKAEVPASYFRELWDSKGGYSPLEVKKSGKMNLS